MAAGRVGERLVLVLWWAYAGVVASVAGNGQAVIVCPAAQAAQESQKARQGEEQDCFSGIRCRPQGPARPGGDRGDQTSQTATGQNAAANCQAAVNQARRQDVRLNTLKNDLEVNDRQWKSYVVDMQKAYRAEKKRHARPSSDWRGSSKTQWRPNKRRITSGRRWFLWAGHRSPLCSRPIRRSGTR